MISDFVRVDTQWVYNPNLGSIRGPLSYKKNGWYFLPINQPDKEEYDVGPFKSFKQAVAAAIKQEAGR